MKAYFYEWIQNLSVYLILMMAVMQLIINKEYQKYFQFFSGLLLILLLLTPVLRITNMQNTFQTLFQSVQHRQEQETLKEYEAYLWDASNLWEEDP
ncbi:MAG: stage III sporulation protein AF [Hespellia sp.]|nr:stage III sporulation protein AF [Hespellia sp.]